MTDNGSVDYHYIHLIRYIVLSTIRTQDDTDGFFTSLNIVK